jgi:hypothetical protein
MMTTPIALLLEATERGFKLEAHGNQLHIIPLNPATRCPPDFAETLRAHKPALLALLKLPFVMVDSQILGETIFFCEDEATRAALVEAGAEPWGIYTRAELQTLCVQNRVAPLSPAELWKIHQIKQTFHGRITK